MGSIIMRYEELNLPAEITAKLKGKEVEIIETPEGILIKPLINSIKQARGSLKGSSFTLKKYMQHKKEEKYTFKDE